MQTDYFIWIGERISGVTDLTQVNFLGHLTNKSLLIDKVDTQMLTISSKPGKLIKDQFEQNGGTILKLNEGGLSFYDFKPFGSKNADSWKGEYLKTTVSFDEYEIARVDYTHPKDRDSLCSRVIDPKGAYMITYALIDIGDTIEYFDKIMKIIKELIRTNS